MDRAASVPVSDAAQDAPHGRAFEDDSYWTQTFGDSMMERMTLTGHAPAIGRGKAPGWVIVAFPIVPTSLLWLAIYLASKLLG